MRIVLSGSDLVAQFIPETQHEIDQLEAWNTAGSAKTTCALARVTDTGREGHAVNPVLSAKHKGLQVTLS